MPRGGFRRAFLYETQPNSQLPPPQKPTPVRFPSPEPSSYFGSISQHLMEIPNQLTLCHVFGVDRATRHWPTPATAAKNSPPAIDPMHEHFVVSSRYHHSLGFLWRPLHVAGLFLVWRPIPWVVCPLKTCNHFLKLEKWNNKRATQKTRKNKHDWNCMDMFPFSDSWGDSLHFASGHFLYKERIFHPILGSNRGSYNRSSGGLALLLIRSTAKTCRDAELIHGIIWLVNRG